MKQILAALPLAVASLGSAQALQFTWLKPIGVNPYTFVQRTAVSPTGAFVVAGVTQNSAATDDSADLYINSYTPLGILSWTRIYNSTADNAEGIRGMAIDSTGSGGARGGTFQLPGRVASRSTRSASVMRRLR